MKGIRRLWYLELILTSLFQGQKNECSLGPQNLAQAVPVSCSISYNATVKLLTGARGSGSPLIETAGFMCLKVARPSS